MPSEKSKLLALSKANEATQKKSKKKRYTDFCSIELYHPVSRCFILFDVVDCSFIQYLTVLLRAASSAPATQEGSAEPDSVDESEDGGDGEVEEQPPAKIAKPLPNPKRGGRGGRGGRKAKNAA